MILCDVFLVNLSNMHLKTRSSGHLLVTNVTFEVFSFLVLYQYLLILKNSVAIPTNQK